METGAIPRMRSPTLESAPRTGRRARDSVHGSRRRLVSTLCRRGIPSRNRTPPSTGAPRRPARRIGMGPIKLPQEPRIHDERPRHPAALLGPIPLPIHQILKPTTLAPYLQQPSHRPLRVSIDHLRRGRGRHGRRQGRGGVRFHLGNVEDRVDSFHRRGKPEAHRSRVNDLLDPKGTQKTRRQFPGLYLQW